MSPLSGRSAGMGLALGLLGSVAFSGKAIIVKLAYRHGVDAVTLIMLRMLFALPLFALMGWWASRGKPGLSRQDWFGVIGLGFSGYYLASYLDFAGLVHISASLERLILYLNPTVVLFLGWLLYRRHATRAQLLGMAVSYSGVLLVFGHELGVSVTPAADIAWGALLCGLSVLSYAIYLVYSGEMVKRLGSLRLVGLATSVACLFCIAQFVLTRPLGAVVALPVPVLWLSVLNATLCTAAPVLMVMMAIERLGASVASQLSMVGPLATILMGVWLLDEAFTVWMLGGTVLVMTGIYVFTRGSYPKR